MSGRLKEKQESINERYSTIYILERLTSRTERVSRNLAMFTWKDGYAESRNESAKDIRLFTYRVG